VYVYGTADNVAPNFTTPAGAITYAQSLTPQISEPVVVRCFTKADGTPYELTDFESTFVEYAEIGIYLTSDFVRMNQTDVLPETLPAGQQVWYIDPNGVETLWVGRENGSAWPAVGYKEYVANVLQEGGNAPIASVMINQIGNIVWSRSSAGIYNGTLSGAFIQNKTDCVVSNSIGLNNFGGIIFQRGTNNFVLLETFDSLFAFSDDILGGSYANTITIRVYP
jgi:hypothetical protein